MNKRDKGAGTACDTAINFRAGLRFPRAAAEPPRRLCSCGVSPFPLFPQESSSCPPING
ncbi:hypothetical protein H7K06_09045 [Priestia aryabhattai]|uniref:hypothetical protein n=1 Tax=Priestia TaxID=2800373 RepID=UPI001C8DE2EF|nr:hypothetical protein [Priestia aryabhattai]MBX9967670.1 hypothetical protein [Priestia aryabhattai]